MKQTQVELSWARDFRTRAITVTLTDYSDCREPYRDGAVWHVDEPARTHGRGATLADALRSLADALQA